MTFLDDLLPDPENEVGERARRIAEVAAIDPLDARSRLLLNRAYAMRLAPTRAEVAMAQIADRTGYTFFAQEVIGQYIVDFYCPELHCIIEVDGPIHRQQEGRDRKRQRALQRMGYSGIRFTNGRVLDEPQSVLEELAGFCFDLHQRMDR